ncbi:MAG TPA: CDP-alcohol phosphatidyltransferase family protein [Gemmatimonadaceae bacterium]|nr:CDP-alcohol phosphatidyltransferase family protein [Gemmatimonadaceae bacterium]
MDRRSLVFLPSVISLTRLAMAAAFVMVSTPATRVWLILAASLTDFLDGWLARRANLTTRWGALIDPVADRMFVFTAVCVFLFEGLISTSQYFLLISRDFMTAVGFLVARAVSWLRPITFRARLSGKVATTLQLLALLAVLMQPHQAPYLIVAVGVASLWAIVDYTRMLWRERQRTPA